MNTSHTKLPAVINSQSHYQSVTVITESPVISKKIFPVYPFMTSSRTSVLIHPHCKTWHSFTTGLTPFLSVTALNHNSSWARYNFNNHNSSWARYNFNNHNSSWARYNFNNHNSSWVRYNFNNHNSSWACYNFNSHSQGLSRVSSCTSVPNLYEMSCN